MYYVYVPEDLTLLNVHNTQSDIQFIPYQNHDGIIFIEIEKNNY
jgi:hypothetical protein